LTTARQVFVDTAAWIALVSKRDALYPAAQKVMSQLHSQRAQLTTTEFVLVEVANALSTPDARLQAVKLINGLRQLPTVRTIPASPELFEDGLALYRNRPDKEWSLTDCISFVVMQRDDITQAFTSDHHFEQAGFTKLLIA
jgi:predicted nucleic acid-binding protein